MKNAYEIQRPSGSVIFHSDLETQCTSEAYRDQFKKYSIIASYSNKGCPYDNAAARLDIFKYIEGWCNRERIYSSIGYITTQANEDLAKASNS